MTATLIEQDVQTLDVRKERIIAAPLDITFQAILDELGPESELEEGKPFPMMLEAWPGGRWYRDLGNNAGHLWGHVQVIKPPALLEISGPLFMSYPAISHVQYRLSAQDDHTRLAFRHRAIGLIPADHREGVHQGWEYGLNRIEELAIKRLKRA